MTTYEITKGQAGDLEHARDHTHMALQEVLEGQRISRVEIVRHLMTAMGILSNVLDTLPREEG